MMCLLCDEKKDSNKLDKITVSYQLSHFIKAYPHIEGKHMVMKNYMKGTWTKKFITEHKILQRHAEGYIWDIDAFFADCDARIAAQDGDGDKAWKALNEEFSETVRKWAVKHGCDKPVEEDTGVKPEPVSEADIKFEEEEARKIVQRMSVRR